MTKGTRLYRVWQRNDEYFADKGIYFCLGKTDKNMPTAKEVHKIIRKSELKQYGMPFATAVKKGIYKPYNSFKNEHE